MSVLMSSSLLLLSLLLIPQVLGKFYQPISFFSKLSLSLSLSRCIEEMREKELVFPQTRVCFSIPL